MSEWGKTEEAGSVWSRPSISGGFEKTPSKVDSSVHRPAAADRFNKIPPSDGGFEKSSSPSSSFYLSPLPADEFSLSPVSSNDWGYGETIFLESGSNLLTEDQGPILLEEVNSPGWSKTPSEGESWVKR